jgi:peptidoglycan hydrolase CwlO-like protein
MTCLPAVSVLSQADKSCLGNAVGRLEAELATAQRAAEDAQQQLSAARQLLLARASQLGSAEGLQGQLEEAAAQLGSYKAKLEAAEQEVRADTTNCIDINMPTHIFATRLAG